MAGGAPTNLGEFSGRVQHGWQSLRRARYTARAPRYLATTILFGFFAIGVRTAFFPTSVAEP
ncbi:MAG: hypothetical protein WB507_07375, partial [Solirubrobacterales bacterium]